MTSTNSNSNPTPIQQQQQQQLRSNSRPNRRSNRNQIPPPTPTPINNLSTPNSFINLSPTKTTTATTTTAATTTPLTGFQRLSLILDGKPHYLEQPGPQNRILLSIKSTIPEDTDYALEVLLAASFYEPDLIPLPRFPGLIDALIDLIELYNSPGLFEHSIQRAFRRRALEATLVIRNLFSLDTQLSSIQSNHPRLLPLILSSFQNTKSDSDHEFLALLLDILDSLATHNLIRLDQPILTSPHPPPPNIHRPFQPSLVARPDQNWPTELVNQLDQLTQSSDRALLLAAYRSFTSIGSLAANQTVLIAQLYPITADPDRSQPAPWPKAIQRALILLALPDVEILMVVLDYLYMLTSASSIALSIVCLHPDIIPIIKLLLVHVHHNSRLERLPAETLPVPEPKWYFQRAPCPEPIPDEVIMAIYGNSSGGGTTNTATATTLNKSPGTRAAPQTLTMSEVHQILLPESQLKDIVNLSEPNRARQWMSRVFEPFPGGEVQQVTLWLAYKTQFELFQSPSHLGPGIQMIAPAEAIKLTSDVFPNALPSVTENKLGEKKFVISGMRVRPKKHTKIWKCHWKECSKNATEEESEEIGRGGPELLYRHIEKTHISPRASICHWQGCGYQSGNRVSLLLHVRTHLQYVSLPSRTRGGGAARTGKGEKEETKEEGGGGLPFRSYTHERWEPPNSGPYLLDHPLMGGGGATGIGFVALLVLRNLLAALAEALTELVKTLDVHHLSLPLPPSLSSSTPFLLHELGPETWRIIDLLSELQQSSSSSSNETTHIASPGLSVPCLRLIHLARFISGSSTPPPPHQNQSSSIDDHDIPSEFEQIPLGFVEKETHIILANGPHFLSVAADILHRIHTLKSDLGTLDSFLLKLT